VSSIPPLAPQYQWLSSQQYVLKKPLPPAVPSPGGDLSFGFAEAS
jgi:hypothetical protein